MKLPKNIMCKICTLLSIILLVSTTMLGRVKDLTFDYGGKLKEEYFYARNINLLNYANEMDEIGYMQHTLDFNVNGAQGKQEHGYDVFKFKLGVRNKTRWGSPASIAKTTRASVKVDDFVTKEHQHFIGKLIVWIREVWMEFSINNILNIQSDSKHFIALGAFPFQLGRGIALGDAFAVNPGILGFYSDDAVDQYAFGAKLNGDFVPDTLSYDMYVGILSNKGGSFSDTSEKIRAQYIPQCDFKSGRQDPYRGPGEVNYVVAGKLNWTMFDSPLIGKLVFEPYAMYNRDPEQRVEIVADANSKLGTVGLAVEWSGGRFEGGFDTAYNMGRQEVVGIDRNKVDLKNDNGTVTFVYSNVVDNDPNDKDVTANKAKVTSANKTIVNESNQDPDLNGQKISTNPLLYNANDRFRAGYENKYRGWMFVCDAAYWLIPGILQGAVTAGVASGDENPNKNLTDEKDAEVDSEYKGFIGLQEIYSGKRVRSAFVLGGSRSLPRPLSVPAINQVSAQFAGKISEFSNLIFTGFALNWKPESERQFSLNPNVLFYWQEHATKAYDCVTSTSLDRFARRYLGVEANLFGEMLLMNDLKGSLVLSYFVPGTHYDDILGKPLTREQRTFIDKKDKTGFTNDPEPLIGNNSAFTINLVVEYKF